MVYSRALHLLRISELDAEFVGSVLKLICGDLKSFGLHCMFMICLKSLGNMSSGVKMFEVFLAIMKCCHD